MKTLITLILVVSGIPVFGMTNYSVADEVVLCLSKENRYVVLSDSAGKCFEEESEIRISSGDIKNNGKLVPLANFVSARSCENGAQGSKVEIGFDLNDNGRLDAGEVRTASETCVSAVETSEADTVPE